MPFWIIATVLLWAKPRWWLLVLLSAFQIAMSAAGASVAASNDGDQLRTLGAEEQPLIVAVFFNVSLFVAIGGALVLLRKPLATGPARLPSSARRTREVLQLGLVAWAALVASLFFEMPARAEPGSITKWLLPFDRNQLAPVSVVCGLAIGAIIWAVRSRRARNL